MNPDTGELVRLTELQRPPKGFVKIPKHLAGEALAQLDLGLPVDLAGNSGLAQFAAAQRATRKAKRDRYLAKKKGKNRT